MPPPATNDERKGAAAVEFAVVLPLLLLLFLGTCEIGRAIHIRHTLMAAAREAGRQAAAAMPDDDLDDVVTEYLSRAGIPTANVDVTVDSTWTLSTGEDACKLTVSIPHQDVRWVLLYYFTKATDRIAVETVWPRS